MGVLALNVDSDKTNTFAESGFTLTQKSGSSICKVIMKRLFCFVFLLFFSISLQATLKLNQPFMPGGSVNGAQFSPINNSSRVVYLASSNNNGINALFSIDFQLGPNSRTNLSAPLVALGSVSSFEISPDGAQVVFLADKEINNTFEVYSVPIAGGNSAKLNNALVSGGNVSSFLISHDSTRVVYRADQDFNETNELYSVSITGGNNIKLSGVFPKDGDAFGFLISPDSSRVVYRADQDMQNVMELYSVPITGGGVTKLNGVLPVSGNVAANFLISSDNSRVVYIADQDNDKTNEIYSVSIMGGNNTKLNGVLPPDGDVSSFLISPDSSRVVYTADQDMDTVVELYSSQLLGGGNVKLNGIITPGGVVFSGYLISPDSSRVVYLADQTIDETWELYSSAIDGSDNVKLNGTLAAGGNVQTGFQISPNNQRVAYLADQTTDNKIEIYGVPLTGGPSVKLNKTLVTEGDVDGLQISPDSSLVVYLADQATNDVTELYHSSLTNNTSNAKINTPLVTNGNVLGGMGVEPQFHPSGSPLLYISDQDTDETFELYLAATRLPIITSDLEKTIMIGDKFYYQITAINGPISNYGASGLPTWATLTNNVITGIPNGVGTFPITLFATNDAGVGSALLSLTVNPSNVVIVTPSTTGFNGDLNGDGVLDLVAQKKTTATLIAFTTNGADTSKALALNKKDKVVGANVINTNHALIVQNKTTVGAVSVDGSFNVISNLTLGSVASAKTKVVAAGDINGDGVVDIITQQGKTIGALLSPSYAAATLVNTKKANPKVVGVLSRIGTSSNAVSSLVLAQGKKLFFYDIPTNAPFVSGEANEPQAGPIFDKRYKVVGAVAGTNLSTAKLIITKGKKVGIINYGANSLGAPVFETTKKLGKIVVPQ